MIAGTIVLEDMSLNFLGGPDTVSLSAADTIDGVGVPGTTECTFEELACVLALMDSDDWPSEIEKHLIEVAEPYVRAWAYGLLHREE